eukprot:gene24471-29574_t
MTDIGDQSSLWAIFQRARELTRIEIDDIQAQQIKEKGNVKRVLKSGHAPGNFVVGDTDFIEFQRVLDRVVESQEEIFVDLGCGKGEVMASAILYKRNEVLLQLVIGIELMHFQMDECKRLCKHLSTIVDDDSRHLPIVECREEDFIESDWSHATIVYACATCFSQTMLDLLHGKFMLLKPNAKVMLLDRELEDDVFFALIFFETVKTSWGTGTLYVYERTEHPPR